MPPLRHLSLALALTLPFPGIALACSSCGCTLNSDWASQGYAVSRGWRFDLRYDYFNQSDLRSGRDSVDVSSFEVPNEEELQRSTINRNVSLGFDYSPSRNWGINMQLPYYDRWHSTLAEDTTELSYSHSRGIGDARIVGRYQGFSPDAGMGILFGVKLPTGASGIKFNAGPEEGERLDAGLQPGTGTTDALLGVYQFGNLSPDWGYFAQAVLQHSLNSHHGFRPGTGLNLNAGVRYNAWKVVSPQLQFNVRSERRESGDNADVENSGATLAYLSPGVNFHFNARWDGYLYTQFPLYQRVNGLQLEPERFYSFGIQYRL
jgi:hypothetical protein